MRKTILSLLSTLFLIGITPVFLACNFSGRGYQSGQTSDLNEEASNFEDQTNLTMPVDRELLRQIKGLGDLFAENNIWRGYNYQSYPQYLVHVTKAGPDRAFLINPQPVPYGALKLGKNEDQGLSTVYRYDLKSQEAYHYLFGPEGNEVFTFNFRIQEQDYYLQAYTDDLSAGMNDPSMTVSYSTHELFHRFQDQWEWVPDATQDFDNFPITSELLELQILCQEVLKELPDSKLDEQQMRELLLQYLAIRTQELALDPSPGKLIKHHELSQEQMEGSAKFIEVMSNQGFFSTANYEAKFGYSLLEFWVESKADVRSLVGQSVYYGTGGSAIYLLYRLGYPIEKMQEGKTPYELAMNFLKPTSTELSLALQKAYSSPQMPEIKSKVKEWIRY